MDDTKLFATRNSGSRKLSISITRMRAGVIEAAYDLPFVNYPENATAPVAVEITEESAVQLMNDLWDAGIRPMVPKEIPKTDFQVEYKKILYALLGISE